MSDVLVSTEWLAAHLSDAGLRIVDVRGAVLPPGHKPRYFGKHADYLAAHIPGAVFVDWTSDIIDPDDPVPVQVARPEAFAAKMSALGVGDDTRVVVYDDYDHIFAGRLAWALRYYGHDDVALLDGGWVRWMAEGRPTSQARPAPAPATFTPRIRPELRTTVHEVERALGREGVLLLDARPANQYAGEASAAAVAGHIPGARNVPYASLIDEETKRFLPKERMAEVFLAAGVDVQKLPKDVIVYCNGGVSCTVPLHALKLLGRDDVAVYDGSWNEWGNGETRPVTRGPKP